MTITSWQLSSAFRKRENTMDLDKVNTQAWREQRVSFKNISRHTWKQLINTCAVMADILCSAYRRRWVWVSEPLSFKEIPMTLTMTFTSCELQEWGKQSSPPLKLNFAVSSRKLPCWMATGATAHISIALLLLTLHFLYINCLLEAQSINVILKSSNSSSQGFGGIPRH